MNIQTKQVLEDNGFQVIEGEWDPVYKTRIFIRHPDGRLNPSYARLNEVPILPNGTEFDLDLGAMPYDEIYGRSSAVVNAGAITHAEWGLSDSDALIPPIPIVVGYIILAVVVLTIAICVYYILHPPAQEPPCGTEPRIIDISDCAKIVVMPNCDSRTFNACTDEWLEEDWHTWTPPTDWKTLVVIGIVGVGAIIAIPKILEVVRRK